jgi:hypothetical protein
MSVYQKLNEARAEFHTLKLKKTGLNKFAGYQYFELGDFLIPALEVFKKNELCAFISYGKELATMRIQNVTDNTHIEITSPMAEAQLKGCHPIQNLGAVETYTRRYLWVTALEIVEHDALDSSKPLTAAPMIPAVEKVSIPEERLSIVIDVAEAIKERFASDDLVGAYDEYVGITDGEEKIALWARLPSNVRSALKKKGTEV